MNSTTFNIEPLVIEIENVIKNGLSVILKDYTERFELLEKTNKQIMRLSSLCELNSFTQQNSYLQDYEYENNNNNNNDDKNDKITHINSIQDITGNLVRKEIATVENKLDKIEKKYELVLSPLIDKILNKLELLNDDIKELKQNSMNQVKPFILKPSIVSSCENENIQFEIKEVEITKKEDLLNVEIINVKTDHESKLLKEQESVVSKEEEENVSVASEEEEDEQVESVASEEEEEEHKSVVSEEEEENVSVASEEEEEEEVESVASEEEEDEQVESVVSEEEEEVETEASHEHEEEVETEASDDHEEEVETEASHEHEDETKTIVEEEDDEAELTIITIDDIDYCTNNEENGFIYEINDEGEQGDKVGYLKDYEPFFYADEKE